MYYHELTVEETEKALALIERLEFDHTLIESERCVACAGSGYYDNIGSPKCGSCYGRGVTPVSDDAVRILAQNLSELNEIDWREAEAMSKKIEARLNLIGLGWENEHYWR